MSCTQTLSGITTDCTPSRGGIVAAWISNMSGVSVTVTSDEVSAISGATWSKYEFRRGTGSITKTLTVDTASGVNYVTSEVILQFSRMETSKRIEIAALSVGEFVMVVKDGNGVYWLLGYDETVGVHSVQASAGTGQTGTASSDGNYYQLTFSDESASWPFALSSAAASALE